jgi:anti-sigma regulatory factor (Ser/Thr protein kinase)
MSPITLTDQAASTAHPIEPCAIRRSATVAADLGELAAVGDALASALRVHAWSEEDAFRVLICVDEAFANALSHGSTGSDRIRTAFRVSAAATTVMVADRNPEGAGAPTLPAIPPESSEHGRGLILMRALADRMLVRGGPRGTRVALAFAAS